MKAINLSCLSQNLMVNKMLLSDLHVRLKHGCNIGISIGAIRAHIGLNPPSPKKKPNCY